ncbi:MAG: hypothetical protein EBW26_04500 [Proteobacteria bacterium]|jgi:hypothetical protein|nr:hypothetical protein [Pseudomonadota bacterium]NCV99904.1 hypothetical protein [Pseudomonadota bacterium]
MKKFIFLSIFTINLELSGFECYSKDSELSDSSYWASSAIDLFANQKYRESIDVVDACFDTFSSEAVIMQNNFNKNNIKQPPEGRVSRKIREEIHKNWAVNDVSVALWSKARSLEEIGMIDQAKNTYAKCIFLIHGRAWDPKGWFWSPALDCVKRGKKLIK